MHRATATYALALLLACGCTLDPVDLRGKACPCAPAFHCEDGICQPGARDGGPADAFSPRDGATPPLDADPAPDDAAADATTPPEDAGAPDTDAGIPPDLILWFPMDEAGSATETIADASGHGHDATCVPACPPLTAGVIGNAYALDAATHFHIPRTPELDLESFTIAAWVRPASTATGYRSIVARPYEGATANGNSMGIFEVPGEEAVFETYDGVDNTDIRSPAPVYSVDTWTHVAATYSNDGTKRLFVGGVELATSTGETVVYATDDLYIAADIDFGVIKSFWHGAIDDVRIYSRALTAPEIADLAAAP